MDTMLLDNGHILDNGKHIDQEYIESLNFHAGPLVKHSQVSLTDVNDIGSVSPENLRVASCTVKFKMLQGKFKSDSDWLAPKQGIFRCR